MLRTLAILALALPVRTILAQRPLNLGFEQRGVANVTWPWGWFGTRWWGAGAPRGTDIALDSTIRREGKWSLRVTRTADSNSPPAWHAESEGLTLQVPALFANGQRLRLTGWIRTVGVQGGARLSLATLGAEGVIVADSSDASSALGLHGTQPWTRYQLEIPVDTMAQRISVTAYLQGTGSAWFDANTLTLDGRPITEVSVAAAPTSADVDWLASQSVSLRSFAPAPIDSQADFGDLAPVGRIVGDARIIALGEATHGTREFFLMKHRLLQYFVRELGVTVFAIEANQLTAERINAYVRGGAGDARTVMAGMFQVWNTKEMLALIEWMQAYNARHPDRMADFVGYDMQDQKPPIDSVRAFLDRTDPLLGITAGRLYNGFRNAAANFNPQVADSVRARWRDDAETMWRDVSGARKRWLAAAPTREDSARIEWAVQNANVVRQAAISNYTMDVAVRDSMMAANIDWLLGQRGPAARAVLWAHDSHVSRGGDPVTSFFGGRSMGSHLARRHGDDLRVFGLETYDGAYSATVGFSNYTMVSAEAFPAPQGSVEEALHRIARRLGTASLVTDLRAARTDAAGRWLLEPRPIRSIGYAAYDFGFEQTAVLPREFDALIFIDRTTPSRIVSRPRVVR